MDAHSLAVVFAPNLIWPPAGSVHVCVHACVCFYLFVPCSFQDIISGSELNMMVSLVEMMINNHIDLFDVPAHVQLPARRYLKRKRGGEVSLSLLKMVVSVKVWAPKFPRGLSFIVG